MWARGRRQQSHRIGPKRAWAGRHAAPAAGHPAVLSPTQSERQCLHWQRAGGVAAARRLPKPARCRAEPQQAGRWVGVTHALVALRCAVGSCPAVLLLQCCSTPSVHRTEPRASHLFCSRKALPAQPVPAFHRCLSFTPRPSLLQARCHLTFQHWPAGASASPTTSSAARCRLAGGQVPPWQLWT